MSSFVARVLSSKIAQSASENTVRSNRSFTLVKLEYLEKDNEFFDAVFLNDRREYSAFSVI